MRTLLLTSLCIALAAPVCAKDSGDAAFDLLASFTAETSQADYLKLRNSVSISEAKTIEQKFTALYGEPNVERSGLKVWEIENKKGTGAEFTTIMCGPDKNGGIYISVDRRGPILNGANTKAKRKAEKKARIEARRLERAQIKASKSRLRSQERD